MIKIENWFLFFVLTINLYSGCHCIKVQSVIVPSLLRSGSSANLSCSFDLKGQSLYSLNWWKDNDQFYQVSLKDKVTIYDTPGIRVNQSLSSLSSVFLSNLDSTSSGIFKCEVVTDFPEYQRDSQSSSMEIIDIPPYGPAISVDRHRYNVGQMVRANCTSPITNTLQAFEWYINGIKVNYNHISMLHESRSPSKANISRLTLPLKPIHFINGGTATLVCRVSIGDIFNRSDQVQISLPGMAAEPSLRISNFSKKKLNFLEYTIFSIFLSYGARIYF